MCRLCVAIACIGVMPGVAMADESNEEKTVSGMSIVGNDEAPKSLVIVPWKSSDLGDSLDVSKEMDDGRGAIDREVFICSLDDYEIRTGKRP